MKTRILVITTIGVILSLFSKIMPDVAQSQAQEAIIAPVDEAMQQKILDATVHIRIGTYGDKILSTSGLATLVNDGGRLVLVTHNHWSLIDADFGIVHFRNADSKLLADINLDEFRALIRYQDNGTMFLDLPKRFKLELVTPVTHTAGPVPTAGDIVLVVHQDTSDDTNSNSQVKLAVTYANVQSTSTKEMLPVFNLRNSNGHVVIPGDSGGGIWYQGQLVGNMWIGLMVAPIEGTVDGSPLLPTTSGIAAQVSLSS